MPTYQYECSSCGHEFEILQSMKDKKLKKCPKCGKLKLVRLIGGGSGLIFKGSGFFATDYKKNTEGSHSKAKSSSDKACHSHGGTCGCAPKKDSAGGGPSKA